MDTHPTPFPVKSQYMKPKSTRKFSQAPKTNSKNEPPPLLREKGIFGTVRNPNIPSRTAPEKPAKDKPSAAKPSQAAPSPPLVLGAKKNPKKKSVCLQEKEDERNGKLSANGKVVDPLMPAKPRLSATPAKLPTKPRLSSTPYRTAERCSKCRLLSKLETSAYWLAQIKLAESVEKHSVSAAFFGLAFESKAEPIGNIRVELKKYLGRYEYLNGEEEWRKLAFNYGVMMKEESSVKEEDLNTSAEAVNAVS